MKLTEHFSLEELSTTSNVKLQDLNRLKARDFIKPLTEVANLLEKLRTFLESPVLIHSGYRCSELNGATPGSSKTSQHMKGEAVDFSCPSKFGKTDVSNTELFGVIKSFLHAQSISFGQLIDEGCDRPYGQVVWIHLSLGAPWRDIQKCGQTLFMRSGVFTNKGTLPQI